jgi:hypothetical protein
MVEWERRVEGRGGGEKREDAEGRGGGEGRYHYMYKCLPHQRKQYASIAFVRRKLYKGYFVTASYI